MTIDLMKARKEQWRRWFEKVWGRIEQERGYKCEKTFEEFCDDVEDGNPTAIKFLAMLHLEKRNYSW